MIRRSDTRGEGGARVLDIDTNNDLRGAGHLTQHRFATRQVDAQAISSTFLSLTYFLLIPSLLLDLIVAQAARYKRLGYTAHHYSHSCFREYAASYHTTPTRYSTSRSCTRLPLRRILTNSLKLVGGSPLKTRNLFRSREPQISSPRRGRLSE